MNGPDGNHTLGPDVVDDACIELPSPLEIRLFNSANIVEPRDALMTAQQQGKALLSRSTAGDGPHPTSSTASIENVEHWKLFITGFDSDPASDMIALVRLSPDASIRLEINAVGVALPDGAPLDLVRRHLQAAVDALQSVLDSPTALPRTMRYVAAEEPQCQSVDPDHPD